MSSRRIVLFTATAVMLFFISLYWGMDSTNRQAQTATMPASLIGTSSAQDLGSYQSGYILPVSVTNFFPIKKPNTAVPKLSAKAALLYDTANDKVLFSISSQKSLPVASLTKLLMATIVLDQLTLNVPVTITSRSYNVDDLGADFNRGEALAVGDLLKAMLIKSSNDAAYALAQAVETKTGKGIVEQLNAKAGLIGMYNSRFSDPAGLNDDAYSTVEDLLKLVKYSKRYSVIWQIINQPETDVKSVDGRFSHHIVSTNKLFGVLPNIVGGKTGYTDGAKGCMILEIALPADDSSLLAIVLGSDDRFADTKTLLEWGRDNFRWH